jgi:hypothetical protein
MDHVSPGLIGGMRKRVSVVTTYIYMEKVEVRLLLIKFQNDTNDKFSANQSQHNLGNSEKVAMDIYENGINFSHIASHTEAKKGLSN